MNHEEKDKISTVRFTPVSKCADSDRHVSGRLRAGVKVAVVFWHKIYVVEYDAVEGVLLEGLHEANVH